MIATYTFKSVKTEAAIVRGRGAGVCVAQVCFEGNSATCIRFIESCGDPRQHPKRPPPPRTSLPIVRIRAAECLPTLWSMPTPMSSNRTSRWKGIAACMCSSATMTRCFRGYHSCRLCLRQKPKTTTSISRHPLALPTICVRHSSPTLADHTPVLSGADACVPSPWLGDGDLPQLTRMFYENAANENSRMRASCLYRRFPRSCRM